jgi:hypothetical protein
MDEIQSPSDDADQLDLTDQDLNGDTLREECGVFGIFGHPEAAAITALGLHALQHRGQEAAGIVSFDGCPAAWRSAMCAIRPPAKPSFATCSRCLPS